MDIPGHSRPEGEAGWGRRRMPSVRWWGVLRPWPTRSAGVSDREALGAGYSPFPGDEPQPVLLLAEFSKLP